MLWRVRRVLCYLLLTAAALLLCLFMLRSRYREVIDELAKTQVKSATSAMINEALDRQIASGEIAYDRIVYFEKDLNGRITALKTNIGEVNRLKTDVLAIINDEIAALDASSLGIPLGSLILPELLSGRGPAIPVTILSVRDSDARFDSAFSQAGINQTLHQLTMAVSVDVSVLVMGRAASFSVETQVVVAQTVIVGDVPATFLQATGGNYGREREN